MSGAPRPDDPEIIYADFVKHQTTCSICTTNTHTLCPYGEHLLEAWGNAERFYARENAVIEWEQQELSRDRGEMDDLSDCVTEHPVILDYPL